ncbi:tlde1 domain-containing protein [Celerinatantimonas sp. YJH-8]|uniref:tlde1 domain-containing protein n=1 Tax=Celerinatantimonas sp. YJH-8 TaxID=3228714 RepID=UPI0038C17A5A
MSEGYSGQGRGKNNPEMQNIKSTGPIPRGKYTIIGTPFKHPHTGIYTLRLQPNASNIMFGRDGFMIHGDSRAHPGQASEGCIILPFWVRKSIWMSNEREIEVVE